MHQKDLGLILSLGLLIQIPSAHCMWLKVGMHNHSNKSDGRNAPDIVQELYAHRNFDAVAFTEHADCFVPKYAAQHAMAKVAKIFPYPHLHDKENSFSVYREEIEQLNTDGITAITGLEMTVAKDPSGSMCHLGRLNVPYDPILHFENTSIKQLGSVAKKLHRVGEHLVAHHIDLCPELMDPKLLAHIDAIEMMNTLSINPAKSGKQRYLTVRNTYLRAVQQGVIKSVTGGMDLHSGVQFADGEVATHIDAVNAEENALMAALWRGQTIATRDIEVIEFTTPGDLAYQEVIHITGKLRIAGRHLITPPKMNIYRDGYLEKTITPTAIVRDTTDAVVQFDYTAAIPEGSHAYNAEIPELFFTSPYRVVGSSKAVVITHYNTDQEETTRPPAPPNLPEETVEMEPAPDPEPAPPRLPPMPLATRFAPGTYPVTPIPGATIKTSLRDYMLLMSPVMLNSTNTIIVCHDRRTLLTTKSDQIASCTFPGLLITTLADGVTTTSLDLTMSRFNQPGAAPLCGLSGNCGYNWAFHSNAFMRAIGPRDYFCLHPNQGVGLADCTMTIGPSVHIGQRFMRCSPKDPMLLDEMGTVIDCTRIHGVLEITERKPKGTWSLNLASRGIVTGSGYQSDFYWLVPVD